MTEWDSEGCHMTYTLYRQDQDDINPIYIKDSRVCAESSSATTYSRCPASTAFLLVLYMIPLKQPSSPERMGLKAHWHSSLVSKNPTMRSQCGMRRIRVRHQNQLDGTSKPCLLHAMTDQDMAYMHHRTTGTPSQQKLVCCFFPQ
ncbi:rCG53072, isoform CRA_a [Rattus norvegicus]|uniref:RCG53072, isoform CRA_a n=1 Tax=Rattus norvegicus TaxID=10116 RepID=A6KPR0_RAT|nr:rCG53072, isoform CRA_a [Rattus norvegicus]EDL76652.1 rCG53072, isoform CRA_a [Rattus norvegicus]EDL76653.1 rCG53072, isoform CRA_a [Rattus norvegicus]